MNPVADWTRELQRRLDERRSRQLFRSLSVSTAGIDFSSNDYLSLNQDGLLARLFESLLPLADFGSTGSRLIRGHRAAFDRAEEAFASWTQTEAALLFHSGYAGNVGGLPCLLSPADEVFVDRLCHASLLDGVRLSGARRHYFRHNDLNDLEHLLARHSVRVRGRRWIVTESVFSMDGDCPDREGLLSLAERWDCLLFLDEAHAIGVVGEGGRGLAFDRGKEFAAISYPLGKAFGLMGCFVAGSRVLKEHLINNARGFIFTTAQPPFLADLLRLVIQAMPEAEMEDRRRKVGRLAHLLHDRLLSEGFKTGPDPSHITPVILQDEQRTIRAAYFLREKGFSIYPIRPPTVPAGSCRLRISIHAGNTADEIEALVRQLVISRSDG